MNEHKNKLSDFLKENWFKILLVLIIVVIIGGSFYWYEWRVKEIRKKCSEKVEKLFIYEIPPKDIKPQTAEYSNWLQKSIQSAREQREDAYKNCLKENGLEK